MRRFKIRLHILLYFYVIFAVSARIEYTTFQEKVSESDVIARVNVLSVGLKRTGPFALSSIAMVGDKTIACIQSEPENKNGFYSVGEEVDGKGYIVDKINISNVILKCPGKRDISLRLGESIATVRVSQLIKGLPKRDILDIQFEPGSSVSPRFVMGEDCLVFATKKDNDYYQIYNGYAGKWEITSNSEGKSFVGQKSLDKAIAEIKMLISKNKAEQ